MKSSTTDYTKANTYLQLLKEEWRSTCKALRDAQVKKDELNYYVYFLVKNKEKTNIPNAQIAEMLGLTRERVGQIYKQVTLKLKKNGGVK